MKYMNPTVAKRALWCVAAITLVAGAFWFSIPANSRPASESKAQNAGSCDSASLKAAINTLSVDDLSKAREATDALLRYSQTSAACRSEVIAGLTQAMDKPDLNFIKDRPTYYLWLNGSHVLGSLKAVEALDLLIAHLDLSDGMFRGSLSNQPAVLAVTQIGELAIPKLDLALRNESNQERRLAAALCLTDIGGPQAMKSLEWAANAVSDKCVRRFSQIALKVLKVERESDARRSESEDEAEIALRRELLYAFRCKE